MQNILSTPVTIETKKGNTIDHYLHKDIDSSCKEDQRLHGGLSLYALDVRGCLLYLLFIFGINIAYSSFCVIYE